MYNYADDNTLGIFSKNVSTLAKVLEEQSNAALDWLAYDELIANPDKFHAIIVKKCYGTSLSSFCRCVMWS